MFPRKGTPLRRAACLRVLTTLAILACCAADGRGDGRDSGDDRRAKSAGRLIESEVAFTVHNPGVPGEATIRGTLVRPAHPKRATGTAVLLLHGAISDRNSWLGPIEGVPSMAHMLAKAGHSVYAIDRLGYGQSVYDPFPGAGWAITPNTQVETIHEVVTQVRDAGAERVVLVGISLGGGLAECYATRYHDADGVVSLAWSNQPPGDAIDVIYERFVIPQFMLGYDHAYFFPPSDGFSEECTWMFHAAGADPDVVLEACADGFFGTSPSGELAGVGDLAAETVANVEAVTAPVLLVFAEHDNFFPGPEYRGLFGNDADTVGPEVAMWQDRSGGDVDVHVVRDAGHAIPLHDRAEQVTRRIIHWIESITRCD